MKNDELMKANAIREYKDEIKWCRSVISSPLIAEKDKEAARARLAVAESELARLSK